MNPPDSQNPNLKNKIVFSQDKTILGMPSMVFVGASLIAIFGVGLLFKSLGGLLGVLLCVPWLMLVFMPLVIIHKADPQAWRLWVIALVKRPVLSAECLNRKSVVVIKEGVGKSLRQLAKEQQSEKNI